MLWSTEGRPPSLTSLRVQWEEHGADTWGQQTRRYVWVQETHEDVGTMPSGWSQSVLSRHLWAKDCDPFWWTVSSPQTLTSSSLVFISRYQPIFLIKPSALGWGLQSQTSLPPWKCKEQFHLRWVAVIWCSVFRHSRLEGESRKDNEGASKTTSNPLSWTHCSMFPWITRRPDWARGCCGAWLMLTNVNWDFHTS